MASKVSNAKELFDSYQKTEDSVGRAREALEDAMRNRSVAVEKIVSALGKGPFQYGGRSLQAVKRAIKDEQGQVTGSTWFFKSLGSEIQVIE
jgi:hypothetical protein